MLNEKAKVPSRVVAQPAADGTWSKLPIVRMENGLAFYPISRELPWITFSPEIDVDVVLNFLNRIKPLRVLPVNIGVTGDVCKNCGGMLKRTGTCQTCTSCGWNEGCG